MYQLDVPAHSVDRLAQLLGGEQTAILSTHLDGVAAALTGRRLVNITGDDRHKGGVYEIMRTALPYLRGAGVDVVWINLTSRPQERGALEFFHVLAHGQAPSKGWRDELPARTEELAGFGRAAGAELITTLHPTDVIVLNDTQTAPVAASLMPWRDRLVWHAHIGTDDRNELVDRYWDVIGPSVSVARVQVFYHPGYAPPALRRSSVFATPGIDPAATKNAWMGREEARTILDAPPPGWPVEWISGPPPQFGAADIVAVQLSRWDPLKDMAAACRVFAQAAVRDSALHAMVVGPSAQSEAEQTQLAKCVDEYKTVSPDVASRVYIGIIGDCGSGRHDLAVRVLQSAADIAMQKSIQEGFGLTVTEAMLREKPVIASAVGGIPSQLSHGYNGVLVPPGSPDEDWITAVLNLAKDADLRSRLGAAARADVLRRHTTAHHLIAAIDGIARLLTQGK
jgi:trehalose synthase